MGDCMEINYSDQEVVKVGKVFLADQLQEEKWQNHGENKEYKRLEHK